MAEDRVAKTFIAGTVLFRDGDGGDSMYVVQSGRIRIFKEVRGREKTLAFLGPGEFFGEMSILNRKPRTGSAEAVEDSKVLVIDGEMFASMITKNSEIAVRLIQRLSNRLDDSNALIDILMHRDPTARALLGLARAAVAMGTPYDDGTVMVPVDAEDLAGQVGIPVDEAKAMVNRLWRLSLLEEEAGGYRLSDVSRLSAFLEFIQMREKLGAA